MSQLGGARSPLRDRRSRSQIGRALVYRVPTGDSKRFLGVRVVARDWVPGALATSHVLIPERSGLQLEDRLGFSRAEPSRAELIGPRAPPFGDRGLTGRRVILVTLLAGKGRAQDPKELRLRLFGVATQSFGNSRLAFGLGWGATATKKTRCMGGGLEWREVPEPDRLGACAA